MNINFTTKHHPWKAISVERFHNVESNFANSDILVRFCIWSIHIDWQTLWLFTHWSPFETVSVPLFRRHKITTASSKCSPRIHAALYCTQQIQPFTNNIIHRNRFCLTLPTIPCHHRFNGRKLFASAVLKLNLPNALRFFSLSLSRSVGDNDKFGCLITSNRFPFLCKLSIFILRCCV